MNAQSATAIVDFTDNQQAISHTITINPFHSLNGATLGEKAREIATFLVSHCIRNEDAQYILREFSNDIMRRSIPLAEVQQYFLAVLEECPVSLIDAPENNSLTILVHEGA